jgi:predicted membrane protein (TIGR00267 family)
VAILSTLAEKLPLASDPISRRYFISNGFDGTLTSVGIAVGSLLSGIGAGLTVFKVGAGAAVGLGTSGLWSVWEIERAEKRIELQEVEDAMLEDLDDTRLTEDKEERRRVNAFMSGLGPVIGVLLPLAPYLLEASVLTMFQATVAAVAVATALLFTFGAYLGSISGQSWIRAGLRVGAAGVVVAAVNLLLPG